MEARIMKPIIEQAPKAAMLAKLLIAEAAKQDATIRDLELAGKLAVNAYEAAMRSTGLAEFQRKAETAFD